MSFPSFFANPLAYNQVRIGGVLVKAVLRKVNGIEIKYNWDKQKPTGSSGASFNFKGADPAGPHKLTFECANGPQYTAEECEADLRALYERWAPVPQATGGAGPAKAPSAYTIGQPGNASTAAPGAPASTFSIPDPTAKKDAAATGTNPGPRPPTLSIENGFVNYHGTTACSLQSWNGPMPTDTNSLTVEIEIIPQKLPVPAGTGAAPAKSPDKFTIGGAAQGGPAQADAEAARAGAGT